ncbi:MAG TPA: TonB-dependent receptor [Saprospiraceae bacterium]|nr:TonB-dependent receptor [Saprospiraceae bacterium]HNT20693.1 TonB-dependent receptor [Saprospiraceae bacterium]
MKQTFFTLLILVSGFIRLNAQNGTIQGIITDQKLSEPLIGATVKVIGTELGSATDIEGFFSIDHVPAGEYTLQISYVSFRTENLAGVKVEAGRITQINLDLVEETETLQEVVVTGDKVRNSEVAILSEIKASMQVVSGISEQQIKKSMDGNAAQIVRRVPGITIVGDRFINIRGLNSRYNNVMLHNAFTPSMETDIKSFSFDIIPAGQIERMLVFKSPSADLPGEFAGGLVKIFTKGIPSKSGLSVEYAAGFRQGTTFNDFYQPQLGKNYWTGFNSGTFDLPKNFPASVNEVINNPIQLELAGKSLKNNWVATPTVAVPDQKINLTNNLRTVFGGVQVGNITSVTYQDSKTQFGINRGDYNEQANGIESRIFSYDDAQYNRNIRIGVLHNWAAKWDNHQIEWKNLFNQNSTGSYVYRSGKNFESNYIPNNHSFDQVYKNILSSQLVGTHQFLQDESLNLEWTFGYNRATRNQPDYRRYRSDFDESSGTSSLYVPFGAAQAFFLGRFSSEMLEKTYSGNLAVSKKINDLEIKAGGALEDKNRTFDARNLGYVRGSAFDFNNDLINGDITELFNNINNRTGVKIDEQTNPSDSYRSSNKLYAGFVHVLTPLGKKLSFSGGLRLEHNTQNLESALIGGTPVALHYPITKWLPSATMSYYFSQKSILKASYGMSLNRPEFRELAPFAYYDFDYNYVYKGSPLKTAVVQNFDTRFEYYPTPFEVFNVALFYKKFKDPIESLVVPGSGSGGAKTFTFANAESSVNYGVEVELKKSLSNLTPSRFLGRFSTVFNATLIHSAVRLGDGISEGQSDQRPLQGQSPFIVNAALNYLDADQGLQVNVLYNVIGKRIFAVGFQGYPDLYEMPRNVLDLMISKELGSRIILKAGVSDLLNQPARILQDGNQDKKWDPSRDQIIQQYAPGRLVQAGLTYQIY